MEVINKIITELKPSATLAVSALAKELAASGKDIIDLSGGEPDIDTPDFIKAAAQQAMSTGKTKYTAVAGIIELRKALAKKFDLENGIKTTADRVVVTNGGKQALHEVLQVCLNPGEEVIIPAPYWVSYPDMVNLSGGVPVIVNATAENSYKLSPNQLANAITKKTKFIIINSPSNPTGAAYSEQELAELGKVIEPSQALVLSDEVYEKITFADFKFCSFAKACPNLADRTVTVNAFSKTYSMTGWRVGYFTGPQAIVSAVNKFQSQTTSNVCSIAQYAALAAVQGSTDFLKDLVANYARRLDLALGWIEKTPGISVNFKPQGAFYLFIRIDPNFVKNHSALNGSVNFSKYLLEQAGVAVVPGIAFGDDQAFRISISSADSNIEAGLKRIKNCLENI